MARKKAKAKDAVSTDNPVKNFAITGYLKDFPKGGQVPTIDDFNTAINELIDTDTVEVLGINSAVMQVEVGANGTMHLQGYFQLDKKSRRSTFNKKVREHTRFNFSIKNVRGSAAQNVTYCTKPTGEWNYSTGAVKMNTTLSKRPIWINEAGLVKKGERSDLKEAIRAIENGARLREVDERYPTQMVRYGRGLRDLSFRKKMAESKAERTVHNVVMFGDAGTGKSYDARHKIAAKYGFNESEIYSLDWSTNSLWFDGYNGEKVLLLDDYEPDSIKRSTLLKMMDIYQFIGQVKGGHIVAEWELLIITTNSPLVDICSIDELVELGDGRRVRHTNPDPAFTGRITEVFDYNGCPNLRRAGAAFTIHRMKNGSGPRSVTPLLPVTLEHGTQRSLFDEPMRVQGATLPTTDPSTSVDSTLEQSDLEGVV